MKHLVLLFTALFFTVFTFYSVQAQEKAACYTSVAGEQSWNNPSGLNPDNYLLNPDNVIFEENFNGPWPIPGWSIMGLGQTNWSLSQTANAGGQAPEVKFSWQPQFNGTSRFVSPPINTTGYTSLALQFKHFVDHYSGTYTIRVETSTDATNWVTVYSINPSGNVGPLTITNIVTQGVGSPTFRIAFNFSGNSYNIDYWYIDQVKLFQALTLDASADAVLIPDLVPAGQQLIPKGKVTNNGTQTISFTANMQIKQGTTTIYNETINVTNLNAFASQTVNFPAWNPLVGNFMATLTVSLNGDQNPANDQVSKSFQVLEGMVPKKPLFEVFTSSTCPPCAQANPIIDGLLAQNPGQYSLIKYQMNWPGSGDPYYTPQGGERRDYYGVTFVPDLYINANQHTATSLNQTVFNQYASQVTAMDISVNGYITQNKIIYVNATITSYANYPAGYRARIAVVEKTTVGNVGTNGETQFHNVMMRMLPTATGTTLGAFAPGTIVHLSESYNMALTFMEEPHDLAVIVFVQNDSNKEVIQSQMVDVQYGGVQTFEVNFSVKDSNGGAVPGATVTLQGVGTKTTSSYGLAAFPGVPAGNYSWSVAKSGLETSTGTVTVTNSNVLVNAVLNIPDFLFFEDFEAGLPSSWTAVAQLPNMVYVNNGRLILSRQSATGDVLAITPFIPLDQAEKLFIELGNGSGTPLPQLLVGTVPDPSNYSSFTQLAEINVPASGFQTFEVNLASYTGTHKYLAFKYAGPVTGYFQIDKVWITAQTTPPLTDIFENFEVYTANAKLVQQAQAMNITYWTTWSNAPGGPEDPVVSTEQAKSGVNSVLIQGANDLVLQLSEITSGSHAINFEIYIPSGKVGYFNILQKFAGNNSKWGMEVYFKPGGVGSLNAGTQNAATFSYPYDQWIYVENLIDIDNNMAYLKINGNLIHSWQWSLGASGGGINQLHALNLYAASTYGTPYFFVDDIHFITGTLVNLPEKPVIPSHITISPNPAGDYLTISSDQEIISVTMMDLTGRKAMEFRCHDFTCLLNVSDLPRGVWIIQVSTTSSVETRKVILR